MLQTVLKNSMCYTYDSFGRVQYIRLPDGEYVGYFYNHGNVWSIQGNKRYVKTHYVKRIHYDMYNHIDSVEYSNGVCTNYTYDTNRQWLLKQKN